MVAFRMTALRMIYWVWASLIVIFADFEQAWKINSFWMAAFDLKYLQNSLGETGCLGNPYFLLTGCLSI